MVTLTHEQIDVTPLLESAQHAEAGGVVLFLGITREMTAGRCTTTLHYDAYETMALAEMQKLHDEACRRWSLVNCHLVHRLGEVPLAQASVAVVTSAPHREAAFNAARWLIDSLKLQVPIWKQERWADGSVEWIHPGESAQ